MNNYLIQEWIEKGNKIENFQDCSVKIVIILDNASFHKKQEILEIIEAEMPNIILEFLPPYSPDYNLIELVWHSAKEYIAHRLFESVDQLEELLNKLLNGNLRLKIKVMPFVKLSCVAAYYPLVESLGRVFPPGL